MNKNLITMGIIGIFLLTNLTAFSMAETIKTNKTEMLYADNNLKAIFVGTHEKPYETIQEGINAASEGCTIYVSKGVYYENVKIAKSINLVSLDKNSVIMADDSNSPAVNIESEGVAISGFTLQSVTVKSTGNNISGNAISNCYCGIYINHSDGNIITNNIISNCDYGIILNYSSNNTINNNKFLNCGEGIELFYSNQNQISGNIVTNNTQGINLLSSIKNKLQNNEISTIGPSICFNSSNSNIISANIISNGTTGIVLDTSNNNTILDNSIKLNWFNIYFLSSSNNIITRNKLKFNDWYSIVYKFSHNNTISNNVISDNAVVGINFLADNNNNTIAYNAISNNKIGISFNSSNYNNLIHHNNFINHTTHASDNGDNFWDNGEEGNYWDDYTGTDENSDGIGDDPYNISKGDNRDYYPLMEPFVVEIYSVNVTCEENEKSVYINQTAEYEIVIKNTGSITDTYVIDMPLPDELPNCIAYHEAELSADEVKLLPNATATVFLNVTPYGESECELIEIKVRATSVNDESVSENVTTTTTAMLDVTPPNVSIAKPTKALYIFDKEIRKFLIRKPLIIGDIQTWMNADDGESGIKCIEIYIDNELRDTLTSVPKSWVWSEATPQLKARHTIKIVAHDVSGNNASAKIDVLRFL